MLTWTLNCYGNATGYISPSEIMSYDFMYVKCDLLHAAANLILFIVLESSPWKPVEIRTREKELLLVLRAHRRNPGLRIMFVLNLVRGHDTHTG